MLCLIHNHFELSMCENKLNKNSKKSRIREFREWCESWYRSLWFVTHEIHQPDPADYLVLRWVIYFWISSCAPNRCLSAEKIWFHGLGQFTNYSPTSSSTYSPSIRGPSSSLFSDKITHKRKFNFWHIKRIK